MKKFILFLTVVLSLGLLLVGCNRSEGSSSGSTTTTSTPAAPTAAAVPDDIESSGLSVGINTFGSSSYALLTLANNSRYVFEMSGDEVTVTDGNYQLDKIIQDIENMAASGVDGLAIWLPADQLYPTVVSICERNQIPFVLVDKIPTDPAIAEQVKASPYFAGAVSPANAVYGQQIAEFALSQGWKSCIISSSSVGDPSDTPRLEAFRATFEAAGGQVLDELHADAADSAQPQIEDSLIANPDIDFIYGIGSDYGTAGCAVLENRGIDNIAVVTSGLDSLAVQYLKNGQLALLSGDNWAAGIFAAVILQNYIEGNPLKDANGNVPYIEDVMPFTLTPEQCDLFTKVFIDNFCYTQDEVLAMSTKNNPGFGYDQFMEVVNNFSFADRAKALAEAGIVSQAELTAAGIV